MTTAHYTVREGLVHDEVHVICEGPNGVVYAGTSGGISRFDGTAWAPLAESPHMDVRALFASRDGALWIRTASGNAVRHWNDGEAPETVLDDSPATVSAEGNVSFSWQGRDRWCPVSVPLRYSYRLDGAEWTPFADRTRTPLFSLPDGPHRFEVRAQDPDLNIEATPSSHRFVVEAPLWKQPWLLAWRHPWLVALVGIFVATVAIQTRRILARDRALGQANQELNILNEELREKSDALGAANVQLQEMAALKTDFFSNVSHELRTPMTAIKGYIDNLLDRIPGPLNERQERYLTRMGDNTDRLTRLSNDLPDLGRIDRGRTDLLQFSVAKVQVRSVVAETVEALRPVADESMLKLTMTGEDVQAMADRDRLAQVVTNLVHNAIKFTDAGGEVAVAVRSDGEGQVLTSVRDTGRGIPEEDYDKIFDRFYQVRADAPRQAGTGLGLPIAKELVELQGGTIWVESEVGVGSTFTFTLSEVDG
jgi:signal transduction histidine kinase